MKERTVAKNRRTEGPGWSLTRECEKCGRLPCVCGEPKRETAEKPTIRLRVEKRRGKPVTVAAAAGISRTDLSSALKEAKTLCGAGGSLQDDAMELQGDHRERLRSFFAGRGWTVKG